MSILIERQAYILINNVIRLETARKLLQKVMPVPLAGVSAGIGAAKLEEIIDTLDKAIALTSEKVEIVTTKED